MGLMGPAVSSQGSDFNLGARHRVAEQRGGAGAADNNANQARSPSGVRHPELPGANDVCPAGTSKVS